MAKIGLALSGGGFRATLFHVGVVRFLKDAGLLSSVTDIASVSGGSIFAAHLVLNWEKYSGSDEQFDEAAAEVVRFVQFDVRNYVVRRMPLQWPLRSLARLARRSTRNLTPNAVLERCYERQLFGDRCLYELPEHPKLHILATSVSNGGLSVFNREGLFVQQRPEGGAVRFDHVAGRMASIPRIVGASSAFPGFFPPVEFNAADLGVRDGEFPTEYFTDGGVYDNLGIRAFSWLKQTNAAFDDVIVSDAGKPFQILSDNSLGFVGQSVRATDILWDRVWQLERENFGKQRGFVFIPITEMVETKEDASLHPVVQAEVQSIRTDLDRFSDHEVNALAQHGYEVARKVYRQSHEVPSDSLPPSDAWAPIPAKRLPGPRTGIARAGDSSPATTAARRLRKSALRRVWSTLLDPRDWTSYLYLAIAALLFGYLPLKLVQFYEQAERQANVIEAIASGDPDIREILDLIQRNPLRDWTPDPVEEVEKPTNVEQSGVEIRDYSRIVDLRHWRPDAKDAAEQGAVYLKDRLSFALPDTSLEGAGGEAKATFTYPSLFSDVEFRQPEQQFHAIVRRVGTPIMEYGIERNVFEVEYDLTQLARREPATVAMEMLARVPKAVSRVPFVIRFKTDLVNVWILFPEDRPYQNYDLVRYPIDRSESPIVMDSRYRINHPYGSLIGWSVVNPKIDQVYECRWSAE